MRIPCFAITITLFLIGFNASSQQRTCSTDQIHDKLMDNDPNYREQRLREEEAIQQDIRSRKTRKAQGLTYKIPVVVHVMHRGSPVGVEENISDDQIYSAIWALNNSYRGKNNSSNTEIEFCLAQKDPNGNPHPGINRVNASYVTDYLTKGIIQGSNETFLKAQSKWPNTRYINIWVVAEIEDNNAASGVQGFAYYPGSGSSVDGIVLLCNAMGYDPSGTRGYNLKFYTSRNMTLAHEMGHALSLYHTFEGDAGGTTCPSDPNGCGSGKGDCISDTPPHIRSAGDCNDGNNACTGDTKSAYIHNYMNYNTEACAFEFTPGQADRMHAALTVTSRAGLATASNLAACGCDGNVPPIVRFTYSPASPCLGIPVQFTDESINFPSQWLWNFEQGTPLEAAGQTPQAYFLDTGPFDVTLTAKTAQGASATLTQKDLISFPVSMQPIPFVEDFEGAVFPPSGWTLTNPDNGNAAFGTDGTKSWLSYGPVAGNEPGTSAAVMNYYNCYYSHREDGLYTPPINLRAIAQATLSFHVAYRYYIDSKPSLHTDTLRVVITDDCGSSYTTIYEKGGAMLATGDPVEGSFIPAAAADWRTETIDLSAFQNRIIRIGFIGVGDYGNNLFIDHIRIDGQEAAPVADFSGTPAVVNLHDPVLFSATAIGNIDSWTWNFGSDASLPPGTTGAGPHSVYYTSYGTKTVTLTVTGPKGADTKTKTSYIHVHDPAGINDSQESDILLYPNPASSTITISSATATIRHIDIYNSLGMLVRTIDEINKGPVSIEALPGGFYTVKIFTDSLATIRKLMKP